MGLGVWGLAEGGVLERLLPGSVAVLLNLPAFIGAVILSGNVHAPNSAVFATLAFIQWWVLGMLFGQWFRHSHAAKPDNPTRSPRNAG